MYASPEGEYDQPYIWVFNAVNVQPGQDLLNQEIQMDVLVGDFILRRVAGFLNVLMPTGRYQIRNKDGAYIEHQPINVSLTDEIAILPEIRYPWNGSIRFDLYNLL